jgi:hypothetical protein
MAFIAPIFAKLALDKLLLSLSVLNFTEARREI